RQESEQTTGSTRVIRSERAEASHIEVGSFAGAVTAAPESSIAAAAAPSNVTVVRTGQKIGRNDPCPCGSGKKYKHCHGR
ncbi:MAG: SEC-C metal-binding domain-containing protein, partial [Rectinema sp.]|nr:SEC-C metal-binding domain-containing protein [Rectinema sp.]